MLIRNPSSVSSALGGQAVTGLGAAAGATKAAAAAAGGTAATNPFAVLRGGGGNGLLGIAAPTDGTNPTPPPDAGKGTTPHHYV
jgi:hypothetical protein